MYNNKEVNSYVSLNSPKINLPESMYLYVNLTQVPMNHHMAACEFLCKKWWLQYLLYNIYNDANNININHMDHESTILITITMSIKVIIINNLFYFTFNDYIVLLVI